MPDQQLGKKQGEEAALELFLDSYAFVTGDPLTILGAGERPDFVCRHQSGLSCGLELVQVFAGPAPQDTWAAVVEAAVRKEAKRREADWHLPDSTILVLQLMATEPRDFEVFHAGADLQSDLGGLGFVEIWAAHWTTVEPFRTVELFGLHPSKWWGRHQRPNWWEKPHG